MYVLQYVRYTIGTYSMHSMYSMRSMYVVYGIFGPVLLSISMYLICTYLSLYTALGSLFLVLSTYHLVPCASYLAPST